MEPDLFELQTTRPDGRRLVSCRPGPEWTAAVAAICSATDGRESSVYHRAAARIVRFVIRAVYSNPVDSSIDQLN